MTQDEESREIEGEHWKWDCTLDADQNLQKIFWTPEQCQEARKKNNGRIFRQEEFYDENGNRKANV